MAFFRTPMAPAAGGGMARPAPRPISGGMARPVGGPMRSPQATEPLNEGGPMQRPANLIGSFKKGGKVKKTGAYKLHKGEQVITAPVARMLRAK